jgi:HK97 family phage prohead protease
VDYATRGLTLEDSQIEVSRSGDGRTIMGYVAVFNVDQDITDQHGTYIERNAPSAFNKTIAERGNKFLVTYNHGKTLYGTPSSTFSIPLGVPQVVRADERGVYTETVINKTELGDMMIEGARSGSIGGMSYSGSFVKSTPDKPRGGFKVGRDGSRTVVTRTEIAMREYCMTPWPAFDAAEVIGVRALVRSIEGLTPDERARLIDLLQQDYELRAATPSEPAAQDTPTGAVQPDEPAMSHSARRLIARNNFRAALAERGITR